MKTTEAECLYGNMTATDLPAYVHAAVVDAIRNHDGALPEELADLFTLTKNPDGCLCAYVLNFAE